MSNLEEVKARGGPVIAIASEGDESAAIVEDKADDAIFVPDVPEYLQPCAVFPFRYSPITRPFCAAATWISRETWPRA